MDSHLDSSPVSDYPQLSAASRTVQHYTALDESVVGQFGQFSRLVGLEADSAKARG